VFELHEKRHLKPQRFSSFLAGGVFPCRALLEGPVNKPFFGFFWHWLCSLLIGLLGKKAINGFAESKPRNNKIQIINKT
jgi:hypothetical protein